MRSLRGGVGLREQLREVQPRGGGAIPEGFARNEVELRAEVRRLRGLVRELAKVIGDFDFGNAGDGYTCHACLRRAENCEAGEGSQCIGSVARELLTRPDVVAARKEEP